MKINDDLVSNIWSTHFAVPFAEQFKPSVSLRYIQSIQITLMGSSVRFPSPTRQDYDASDGQKCYALEVLLCSVEDFLSVLKANRECLTACSLPIICVQHSPPMISPLIQFPAAVITHSVATLHTYSCCHFGLRNIFRFPCLPFIHPTSPKCFHESDALRKACHYSWHSKGLLHSAKNKLMIFTFWPDTLGFGSKIWAI